MDQAQDMRKKADLMQGEITIEDPGTQEVLVELKDITTHLLIHPGSFMHLKSQGATHKCLLLGIKEEDMSWTTCKESLGSLSHQPLMVKTKGEMMLKLGCLESENIFSCIATHLT
jgi:hypothetical protein